MLFRSDRDHDDPEDEQGRDAHAVRPLDDVDHRRVGEDDGDHRERDHARDAAPMQRREPHRHGRRRDENEHPGRVRAPLSVDVGAEHERDDHGDRGEDDLALGDLSAIPDPIPVETHSAPSVNLPRGERDVILCTMDTLPGLSLIENFGIVAAHRTIPRRLFREDDLRQKLEKELRAVPNRAQASLPASHFQTLLRDLLFDLQKAALSKGANSVLGIRLEAFSEFASKDPRLEQLRLVAIGTAAVVEKAE